MKKSLTADYLLTADVARLLDVTPKTVHQLHSNGHLTAERTAGGVRLFDRADVDRLAKVRAARKVSSDR